MNKELSDELKAISSNLLPKHELKTPEGYFDGFPDRVLKQWKDQHRKRDNNELTLSKMIAAAAVVTGISIAVALMTITGSAGTLENEITSADAYEYIITHLDEFEPLIEEPFVEAARSDFQLLETEAVEEYLLEELDGQDVESIF